MNSRLIWELEKLHLRGRSFGLRIRPRVPVTAKAYVLTAETDDPESFLKLNVNWYFSESLERPFMYVPEAMGRNEILHCGELRIPAGESLTIAVQQWAKSQSSPEVGFDLLIIDVPKSDGTTLSLFLNGVSA